MQNDQLLRSLFLLLSFNCIMPTFGSLGIKPIMRNNSDAGRCDLLSIILLPTGKEIFLQETKSQFIFTGHPDAVSNETCLYHEENPNSSRIVAISIVKNIFSVMLFLENGEKYFIENATLDDPPQEMKLLPFNELKSPEGYCGVTDPIKLVSSQHSPQMAKATLDYYNHTVTNYFVELYVVVDTAFYNSYFSLTRPMVYQIVNYVNALYRPEGIHFLMVGLEVWSTKDPFPVNLDSEVTLTSLKFYRTTLTKRHDVLHLISGINFAGSILGLAYTSGMCQYMYSASLSSDYSRVSLRTASIMAHELGHNLGVSHDATTCSCKPDATCIMNAYIPSGQSPQRFSDCSREQLATGLGTGISYCLKDLPVLENVINYSLCGNGIVEPGEDCDIGFLSTSTACCNPVTCRFQPNAKCASGLCCDKLSCTIIPLGTTCRPAKQECDLPEYCDGQTENCPLDYYKMNGILCDDNGGYCYNGECGSQSVRCRSIYGSSSTSGPASCYDLNSNNSPTFGNGYCSYSIIGAKEETTKYNLQSCATKDKMCGLLHCETTDPVPVWSSVLYNFNFTLPNSKIMCSHIFYDVNFTGLLDPGRVPNGGYCGSNKWCSNGICQNVPPLPATCLCNGNGQCDNTGACFCLSGYNNTDCSNYNEGCGGSINSGPACNYSYAYVDPNKGWPLSISLGALIGIIVGIVVVFILIGVGVYIAMNYSRLSFKPSSSQRGDVSNVSSSVPTVSQNVAPQATTITISSEVSFIQNSHLSPSAPPLYYPNSYSNRRIASDQGYTHEGFQPDRPPPQSYSFNPYA